MVNAKVQTPELVYEGSVKRVLKAPEKPGHLWFEFTDDYSVFDWGKMPDTIANKGRALAVIGAYLFQRLSEPEFWQRLPQSRHLSEFDGPWLQARFKHEVYRGESGLKKWGAPTHFTGLIQKSARVKNLADLNGTSDPVYMEVLEAEVLRPTLGHIQNHSVYVYPAAGAAGAASGGNQTRFVPLEIVFRFGMPSGSSLTERLKKDPAYAKELGVEIPSEAEFFSHPVLEFYTKLEAKDRLLSWQEAVVLSGLSGQQFENLVELALQTALALHVIFAEKGIELWDGKLEMVAQPAKLLLADSIGPDELRLLYKQCHLSKEIIRQVYRGSNWENSLKRAQKLAQEDGSRSWKEIARDELRVAPEPLPSSFKGLIDKLYGALANHLTQEEVFFDHPSLEELAEALPKELDNARHDLGYAPGVIGQEP
jgi:phosphoribosylaminoimidazole-succinocarboxamide synthase